ncbi:cysteine hydrolase [Candidatus Poribacteria bacterium]|nr:cysteine hydrolase [Candidatus Poribacteria bacterium]MBT5535660.1 cysteine hydrolase [Candidatus Poribacteria bacterium]MBT5713985.1 cysteine hydrolase [Candidatus Poribacteria bacterium]MBT7100684.1 cysteine hydrolase [Candidatus Poribacteria bacterium]MBT7806672.1 cysteine hydrolase [Candidatus Poribacteria bacterium]
MPIEPKPTFWDVDTQVDFIMPGGKLAIAGAEAILPNLGRLTRYARDGGIRVMGSVDWHSPDDAELSERPDYPHTFPPHCLAGTPGSKKVPETAPTDALWVANAPEDADSLAGRLRAHGGEIYLRKQRFDVFTNPNTETVLETVRLRHVVVYGVALDVCNAHVIDGFLRRGGTRVSLVLDATRAIDPRRGEALVAGWTKRGVQVLSTDDVLAGATED